VVGCDRLSRRALMSDSSKRSTLVLEKSMLPKHRANLLDVVLTSLRIVQQTINQLASIDSLSPLSENLP